MSYTDAESARIKQLEINLLAVLNKFSAAGVPRNEIDIVDLLAVTKYADNTDVRLLLKTGRITLVGENKVQDAVKKWGNNGPLSDLRNKVKLHFIGHLQTNKAAAAVDFFDWIDSVDSLKLAIAINKRAAAVNKKMPILMQLKLSGSETQGGISLNEASGLLAEIKKMPFLCPSGYMAIAPIAPVEELRPVFKTVKQMFDRDFTETINLYGFKNYLSLGMSGDFETAVQEGSNLPRVGSLLFA